MCPRQTRASRYSKKKEVIQKEAESVRKLVERSNSSSLYADLVLTHATTSDAGMDSRLATFIEHEADSIIAKAIEFARSIDLSDPLDDAALRDHLPEIIESIVADLRTPQTREEEIEKSEGRSSVPSGQARSAAGTHAIHRAHSGYDVSDLVSEYRALRASVLRAWSDSQDWVAVPAEITRFNEAIDEAITESVKYHAAEIERWRDIFLGVLGHDLRSPLSAILLSSDLIARTAIDAPIAKAAQRLIRSGQRMQELLDRLLVYNRAQLGIGFKANLAEVDLAHACQSEIEILRDAIPQARIVFGSPSSVLGKFDAGRIREALANLVTNAAKYGVAGGDIRVDLSEKDDDVELVVSNDGDPISRELLTSMYEPLRRAGVANGVGERGLVARGSLGLGLFIVSQIAKAHRGTIRAESADGMTTFTLRLRRTGT